MGKRKTPERQISDRVLEAVRNHPETVEVNIGGQKMLFLLCGRGAKLANERGHDPIPPIMAVLKSLAPAIQDSGLFTDGVADEAKFTPTVILDIMKEFLTGEFFEALTVVVWWGVLAAQPDIELEEIEVLVTPAGMNAIFSQVWPKMLSYTKDLREEDEGGDEGGDGKDTGGQEGN